MALPSLEIHVPASPTPRFFNMIRCLAGSLRRFGGAYRDAPLVVTLGDVEADAGLEKRLPWLQELGIEIRWIPEALYERDTWFATGLERFRYRFRSDVVLLLDADLLVRDSFEEMVDRVHRQQAFAGLIAFVTPFYAEGQWQRETEIWRNLYDSCGLEPLRQPHQYTAWNPAHQAGHIREIRFCPPYFNFGVLCAPGALMNRIGEAIYPLTYEVDRHFTTDFRCQIALTLAIVKLGIPYWTLPVRYNFPTGQNLEDLYPAEFREVRLLHLLGKRELEKGALFADVDSLRAAVSRRDLRGVDEVARQTLAAVLPGFATDG